MQTGTDTLNAFEQGQIISDRYEVVRRLGAGSMGLVLQAVDLTLDREPVALKLLYPHLVSDKTVFARFRNEVVIARRLSHPNIVRLYDFGHAGGGYYYISMEFVSGYSLKDRIYGRRFEQLTVEETIRILFEIGQGLQCAHERGVVHRDLKPDNILISERGEIKVTDFGLARQTQVDKGFTQSGETVGTPCYMAPEQIRGERVDARADIYSLGIMAYEMVTCEKPFDDDNWLTLASMHLKQPMPDFPIELGIPGWFQDFVFKSTAKDPDDRYQSTAEWCEALREQIDKQTDFGTSQTKVYTPAVLSQYVQKAAEGRKLNRRRRKMLKQSAALLCAGVLSIIAPMLLIRAIPPLQREVLRVVRSIEGESGNLATLRQMIGVSIPLTGEQLAQSVLLGDEAAVKLLLSAGVAPTTVGANQDPVVFSAVASKNSQIVDALLAAGASADMRDRENRTLLMRAVLSGDIGTAEVIVKHSPQVDALDSSGRTAWFYAAELGSEVFSTMFQRLKSDPTVVDSKGTPLLVTAVRGGSFAIVRALVEAGAPVSRADSQGNTPLIVAAESGNRLMMELLLQRGASLNERNRAGKGPRDLATGEARGVIARARTDSQSVSAIGSSTTRDTPSSQNTRLRTVGDVDAAWQSGALNRLLSIAATVRNVGEVAADNVKIVASVPGGKSYILQGPTQLGANSVAQFRYELSPEEQVQRARGEIKISLECSNCFR